MLNLLSLFKHHPNNIIDPKQYNIIPSYFLLFLVLNCFRKNLSIVFFNYINLFKIMEKIINKYIIQRNKLRTLA